jgi:hypothetical protein
MWTSPKTELDVTNLAMKWKTSLMTQGCESFFDRGLNYEDIIETFDSLELIELSSINKVSLV